MIEFPAKLCWLVERILKAENIYWLSEKMFLTKSFRAEYKTNICAVNYYQNIRCIFERKEFNKLTKHQTHSNENIILWSCRGLLAPETSNRSDETHRFLPDR